MINGLIMALSLLFIAVQLPIDRKVLMANLWLIDSAMFVGVGWLAMTIRSTDIAVAASVAGVATTLMLHTWKWGLKLFRKI